MFLQIGLLMSIMSALIPEIIEDFQISYGMASVLPFAFYIALAFSCIPAGIAGERYKTKKILLFAFLFALTGVLVFVLFLNYWASVISLFIIGVSVAIIQVIAVPLLRRACGPENLAFHSTLNQLMYGAGAFLSPVIYSGLSRNLLDNSGQSNVVTELLSLVVPAGFEWVSAYWLFIILLVSLLVIVTLVRFPDQEKDRVNNQERRSIYGELFRNKYVILYFFALVAYASCEQGIAAWMSQFFQDYHGLNPQLEGASILSFYWLLLTVGCLGGMLLLKLFDSQKVLAALTILAIISLSVALYGGTTSSKIAFPMVGAFESVMWPIILSLALNSVHKHHEAVSGLMFTASIGGALGPVIIGNAGDLLGLGISLNYLYLPLLVVLGVSFWARPLISNQTIKD